MKKRVTVEEIDRQRYLGWPDIHPETYCHRCARSNPVWSIDSDRWNTAVGLKHRAMILCPPCFIEFHEATTGMRCSWTLVPNTQFKWIEDGE